MSDERVCTYAVGPLVSLDGDGEGTQAQQNSRTHFQTVIVSSSFLVSGLKLFSKVPSRMNASEVAIQK